MEYINLTPHDINIFDELDNVVMVIASSGRPIPRVSEVEKRNVEGVGLPCPVVEIGYGQVTDIPPRRNNVYYIVSRTVAQALPDREDLLFPTDLVRDDTGTIIGCRKLARFEQTHSLDFYKCPKGVETCGI